MTRTPGARYTSFDYCFNYFQSFREQNRVAEIASQENMQLLGPRPWLLPRQLGNVPRSPTRRPGPPGTTSQSWKSSPTAPPSAWELDAHCYTTQAWPLIRQLDQQIRAAFGHTGGVSYTLVTKVLLGVFGNVPAFDTFFRTGFHAATFGPKAFRRLGEFYREHADIIERNRILTLDFQTGGPTQRRYSRAKVIDMIFFIEGGGSSRAI